MRVSARYLAPNAVTIGSMCLGLGAVYVGFGGDLQLAAWMIIWSVLLDKVDGTLARLLRASSRIGTQLDSFADFVAFGIAPAALVLLACGGSPHWQDGRHGVLLGICGFYVAAAAIRLARFNVSDPPLGRDYFYGVPTTMVAAIIAAAYLTIGPRDIVASVVALPLLLILSGLLMVSTFLMPKLRPRRSRALNGFQVGNVVALYVLAPMRLLPEYMLGLAVAYLVIGSTWAWWRGIGRQAAPDPAATS